MMKRVCYQKLPICNKKQMLTCFQKKKKEKEEEKKTYVTRYAKMHIKRYANALVVNHKVNVLSDA